MEFSVPKFIEMETKIVGPFTWRQFIFVGTAGALIFFLFFIIGKQYFFLYIVIVFILGISSLSLAFLRIGGHPLPNVMVNMVLFTVSSKIYTWKRREGRPGLIRKKEKITLKKEKPEAAATLKITKQSRLKDLSNQIELKTK